MFGSVVLMHRGWPNNFPPAAYSPTPPPDTLIPPIFSPTIGSRAVPYADEGPLYATVVLTGLLACKPKKLPPGWTAAYKLAVDIARPFAWPDPLLPEEESRLNRFAVFAL